MRQLVGLRACVLLLIAISPAFAHPGIMTTSRPLLGGLVHSFTGIDHALAMIGVGCLSTRLNRNDVLLLPLIFVMFLIMGAVVAALGMIVPQREPIISASCTILGVLILYRHRVRFRVFIIILVSIFGYTHGQAHIADLPNQSNALEYGLGFVFASATMHCIGILIGYSFKEKQDEWLIRVYGSIMTVSGIILFLQGPI